jgi:hypothetical protein
LKSSGPGSGQVTKLVNQALVAVHTETHATAFIVGTVQQMYNAARTAVHGTLDQTVVAQEMEKLPMSSSGNLPRTCSRVVWIVNKIKHRCS